MRKERGVYAGLLGARRSLFNVRVSWVAFLMAALTRGLRWCTSNHLLSTYPKAVVFRLAYSVIAGSCVTYWLYCGTSIRPACYGTLYNTERGDCSWGKRCLDASYSNLWQTMTLESSDLAYRTRKVYTQQSSIH